MNIKIFLLIAVISVGAYAQDTLYVGEFGNKIVTKLQAKYYKVVLKDSINQGTFIERRYKIDGTLKSKGIYDNYYSKKKKRLRYLTYYKDGKIHLDFSYKKGKIDGNQLSYWQNGTLKRKDLYKMNKFINGQCWDEKGRLVPYYDFEINANFPEGQKALNEYIKSKLSKIKIPKTEVGSKLRISFYIDEDGSVSDVKLLNGVDDPLTNYKIVKVVMEMPKWSPAKQDGSPVRVKRVLPITL